MLNKKEIAYLTSRLAGIANASNDGNITEALRRVIADLPWLNDISKAAKCPNTTVIQHVREPKFSAWRQQLIMDYGTSSDRVPEWLLNEAVTDVFVAWAIHHRYALAVLLDHIPDSMVYSMPTQNLDSIFATVSHWDTAPVFRRVQVDPFMTAVWRPEVVDYLLHSAPPKAELYNYINPGMSLPTVRYIVANIDDLNLDELERVDILNPICASMLETHDGGDSKLAFDNYIKGWGNIDILYQYLGTEPKDGEHLRELIRTNLYGKEDPDVVDFTCHNYVPVSVLRKFVKRHSCSLTMAWKALHDEYYYREVL